MKLRIMVVGIAFLLGIQILSKEAKTDNVMEELFKLHESIIKETSSKIDVKQLETLLKKGGDSKMESEAFQKAIPSLKKLGESNSLELKREAYSELIETLSIVVKPDNKLGGSLFYCPMVKKKWISKGDKILNPYDKDMRNCGEKM